MKNIPKKILSLMSRKSFRTAGVLLAVLAVAGAWGALGGARDAHATWKIQCDYYHTVSTYYGSALSNLSVEGTITQVQKTVCKMVHGNSPFIYVKNAPEGTVSVAMSSPLDEYLPKPLFNQKNGWLVQSEGGKLSVAGKEEGNLFYELAVDKIDLSRNGQNFPSKAAVISFLENSDFFTKLGFSAAEKQNSLNYFIPKIQSAEVKNNYYLTILSDSSIANISTLSVSPQPKDLVRSYFALYPTDTPVQTMGDLEYPVAPRQNSGEYAVKETGEILVYPEMTVSWSSADNAK